MCSDLMREAGQKSADAPRRPFDVTRTIEEVLGLIAPIVPPATTLHLSSSAPVYVVANPKDVFRILFNLIHNAVAAARATGMPRRIELALEQNDTIVTVRIADDGPGLPQDVRARLVPALPFGEQQRLRPVDRSRACRAQRSLPGALRYRSGNGVHDRAAGRARYARRGVCDVRSGLNERHAESIPRSVVRKSNGNVANPVRADPWDQWASSLASGRMHMSEKSSSLSRRSILAASAAAGAFSLLALHPSVASSEVRQSARSPCIFRKPSSPIFAGASPRAGRITKRSMTDRRARSSQIWRHSLLGHGL